MVVGVVIIPTKKKNLSPPQALQVTTEGEAPGAPPRDVEVSAASSSSLKVSWLPPDPSSQHGRILAYYIGYGQAG